MNGFKGLSISLRMMGKRLPIYLLAIFMMTAMNALFEVMGSVFMQMIFDAANYGALKGYELKIAVTIILAIVSISLASVFMCIYNNEAKRMALSLKNKMFEKTMKFPYEYYEEHHSGEILSKMVYDTDIASNIYSSRLRRVLAPIIYVIVFAVAMIIINPFMTMILFLLNIMLFIFNAVIAKPMKTVGKNMSTVNMVMTTIISNIIAGAGVTKIYDVNHVGIEKYKFQNKCYIKLQKEKMFLLALLDALNTAFDFLCSLMFIVIGIILMQNNLATVGEIAAIFSLYMSLSFRFLQLGKNLPELVNCIAYMERIVAYLELPEERQLQGREPECKNWNTEMDNAVVFENITFGYKGKERLFCNKTYEMPLNKTVAVIGTSGCGKSTLAKLLLGFYELHEGCIYVLNQRIDDIGLMEVRKRIAYVSQVPYMYNFSIMENIRCGKVDATDEDVIQAAKLVNAHDFIMQLENGYHTVLVDGGNNMSGGQRQRIALARAVLKDAPILLLDEATSALDNESEQFVEETICKLKEKKTILVIAHRLTTIQNADVVMEIANSTGRC